MKKTKLNKIIFVAAVAMCGLFVSCPIQHPGSLVLLESMAMNTQNQCTLQSGGGGSQYLRPSGILDLALTNHYLMFPHLYNNLPSTMTINKSAPENLDVEINYITILGATVRLDIPSDIYHDSNVNQSILYTAMTDGYFTATSGGILPGSDEISEIEVIPASVGRELQKVFKAKIKVDNCSAPAADVYAYINVDGITMSGAKLASNTYLFPIRLCWGCLIRYVTNDPTGLVPQGNQAPCLPGQDDALSNVLCTYIVPPADQGICYPDKSCAGR